MKKYTAFVLFLTLAFTLIPFFQPGAGAEPVHKAVFMVAQRSYIADGQTSGMDAAPFVENGRTYVPVRFLAYALGIPDGGIRWDGTAQSVTLSSGGVVVQLAAGSTALYLNGIARTMDVVPLLKNDRTFLPARWVAEAFGYTVAWDEPAQAVLIGPPGNLPETPKSSWTLKYEQRDVDTSTGVKTANLVYVNMNNPAVEIRPVMAEDRVGRHEELASMAGRTGAAAAINGTFFNAYDSDDLLPYGTLAYDYRYYHLGSDAAIGVDDSNRVFIGTLTPVIEGATNNSWAWPDNWYAWGLNHPYADGIEIFTPEYKDSYTPPGRTAVTVQNGVVAGIGGGRAAIPSDGYVIWYGTNNGERADQFFVGKPVDYRVVFKENQHARFKAMLSNAPLLLSNGETALGEVSEPKFTIEAPRSFVGITRDNVLVMGTVDSANIWELAEATRNLGLKDALNLDGGASCGLYYKGETIRQPGRLLSNCLAVMQR